jgi:ABC-2 type transport system ATP-binding protein
MSVAEPLLVRVEGLGKFYGARVALDGLHLELRRGEVLGLLGPNGAGKSTTLRILSGVLAPSRGRVRIGGIDLEREPKRAKALLGFLPEQPPLYPELTVNEYLGFCARLRGLAGAAVQGAVMRARKRCGLEASGGRRIGNLSKGYQQRVGIAQAILHDPPLVILDEPTSGLDPNQIRDIRALIAELGRERGVILSSHILPEVHSLCSRVAILNQGRKAFEGDPNAPLGGTAGEDLLVELARPPAGEALAVLPGVVRCEHLGRGRFRLRLAPGADRPILAVALTPWGLRELTPERPTPEQPTLEQLFTRLTSGEEAGPRA